MSIFDFPEYLPDAPKKVIVRGFMDDGFCPICELCLDDLVGKCPMCGTQLDWEDWIRINMSEKGSSEVEDGRY